MLFRGALTLKHFLLAKDTLSVTSLWRRKEEESKKDKISGSSGVFGLRLSKIYEDMPECPGFCPQVK